MSHTDYRKFPGGARCEQCPTRYYYLEDGYRYCKNGHQVHGYQQFDIDEELNYGKGGKTSRRKKEKIEKVAKHLTGYAAKELYVECLQLVLRRQVVWLVQKKGVPDELEAIVRALFDLRLRKVAGLRSVAEGRDRGKGKDRDSGSQSRSRSRSQSQSQTQQSQSESDGSHALFSSLPEDSAVSTDGRASRKKRHWTSEHWDLPVLVDTLALCYLGCLLLRQPVRVGDIYRWAKAGKLPYLGTVDLIPKSSRDRLPGWAQSALQARNTTFQGDNLHRAVRHLVSGYSKNYGMKIPALNWSPILLKYLWNLALPPDVHKYTEYVIILLELVFSWPAQYPRGDMPLDSASKKAMRQRLISDPDVLLAGCVVFVTKYLYPLDDFQRSPETAAGPSTQKIDWSAWQQAFQKPDRDADKKKANYENVRPSDVWSMSEQELDAFLDFFQETKIEEREDVTEIERLFPLKPLVPAEQPLLPVPEDVSDSDSEQRNMTVSETMVDVLPRLDIENDETLARIGGNHQIYRHVEDLTGPAKAFYEEVARIVGLSVKELVRAVHSVEMLWEDRKKKGKRQAREEESGSDA